MRTRMRKLFAGVAALAALAFGAAAISQGQTPQSSPGPAAAPSQSATPDKSEKADGPETGAEKGEKAEKANEPETGAEKAEKADGPETGAEKAGSEVPNDDGPGGHADEPGNPNADHQNEGAE